MAKSSEYTKAGSELQRQHDSASNATTLVRRQMEHHQAFLKARTDQLAKWCTHGLRPEALLRFCMLDLQQSDKLRLCDTGSIYLGLLACAQAGLEPGALKQEAFLVPFFDGKSKMYRATFICGWRGLVKQMRRSREVKNIYAQVAHERDAFKIELGTQPRIMHEPALSDRGGIIGAYAVAQLSHGLYDPEWMDLAALDKIRAMGKRGDKESPAWSMGESEMYRKAPIRRISKRLPMGADFSASSAIEQAHDDGKPEVATQILDMLTDGEASRAEQQSATGRGMAQAVAGAIAPDFAFDPSDVQPEDKH